MGIESPLPKTYALYAALSEKKDAHAFFLAKRICLFNGFVSQVATTLYYSPPNETSKSPPPLLMRASGIMNDFSKPKLHHDS